MNYNFIGIDVSNKTLDIFSKQDNTFSQVQNDYRNISNFFKKEIKDFENIIVISEATGVYSSSLVKSCCDLSIKHYEVNPKAMNQLGKNIGDRNKTDKIDAEKIAIVGNMLFNMNISGDAKNRLSITSSNDIKSLKSVMSAIRSVKHDRVKFKQRISSLNKDIFAPKSFINDMEKSIKESEKIRKKLTEQAMLIMSDMGIKIKFDNLCTIPGINSEVALELIVFFIDLSYRGIGVSDRSKVKAFAGIDVSLNQSGTSLNKKRISKQGNKNIRSMLQIGTRCWYTLIKLEKYKNTNLGLFFQRMVDKFSTKDKLNGNSISTAMSRKTLLVAWGVFWNDKPYDWS